MNLTLTFQFSIYLLIALSSIMFMMAEGGVFPQLLTIPLGLLTLFFTDRWNKFSLSPLWANVLGLLAFLVVCAEFFSNIEGRLLSGAHFLVYLTWIILLQKKEIPSTGGSVHWGSYKSRWDRSLPNRVITVCCLWFTCFPRFGHSLCFLFTEPGTRFCNKILLLIFPG